MSRIEIVEIFPPIGIARLGDASSPEYFFAPEVPGRTTYPIGSDGKPITTFRNSTGSIKQQAVKFRVYGFDKTGKCVEELTKEAGYTLTWKVKVANTKAAALEFRGKFRTPTADLRNPDVQNRSTLMITPPVTTIDSNHTGGAITLRGNFLTREVLLGSVNIDTSGRLIFRGGNGLSQYVGNSGDPPTPDILSEFDNLNWYDDVCDGWVDVRVERIISGIPWWIESAAHKATVITGAPKFAWGINDTTNLYDVMEDIYHKNSHPGIPTDTRFYRDIWPVLVNSCAMGWASSLAAEGHGPDGRGNFTTKETELSTPPAGRYDPYRDFRQSIFDKLRQPGNPDHTNVRYMPRLSGNDGDAVEAGNINPAANAFPIGRYGSLTALQYARFEDWAKGRFVKDARGVDRLPADVATHPDLLTRAALEQTTGTQMYPGIEVYWIAQLASTYDTRRSLVRPPFRVNYTQEVDGRLPQPGDLTARLSLPWQSDFSLCSFHWWPAARPDNVVTTDASVRKDWVRGLRVTPDNLSSYPGSTDMVKYWSRLGFLVKDSASFKWTERERQSIPPPPA